MDKSLNLKYYDRTTSLYKKITKDNLDYSTFTTKLARAEIDTAKDIIKELYRFQYVYTLEEIINNIIKQYPEDKKDMFDLFFVYQALDELIPISENDFNNFKDTVYDKYNVGGYIIFRGKYYIFQPFNENEDTLMYYRSNYVTELNHELSVYEYMSTDDKSTKLLKDTDKYTKKEAYKYTMEYYDDREDNFVVGVLDTSPGLHSNQSSDVFKLREKRNTDNNSKRKTISIKGAICYTAKEKEELLDMAKRLGVKLSNNKNGRQQLCDLIKQRLLFLEKYENDNKVYMIIPNNHPTYPFPLRLSDRVDYINKKVNRLLYTTVTFEKKKQDNGIFEGLRDLSLPRYSIKFKHSSDYDKHTEELNKLGFQLKDGVWMAMIE
jgi:hypothetical protein